MIPLQDLRQEFVNRFGAEPRFFRAPGRVNLIGGHLDYNEGWVLPIAIDRSCFVSASARPDNRLRIHSVQMQETFECALDDPRSPVHHWSDYIRGVAWALAEAGKVVGGANLLISNEVPLGGGLSSSAALEVSSAFALLSLRGETLEPARSARICQRAENEYVGMRCGIMDQLMACAGRRGYALLIDCRTLEIEQELLDETQVSIVVANTMTKHQLAASSEYNRRRAECDDAVERVRAIRPEIKTLRDVSWEEIASLAADWPENLRRRARHVTTEMVRVREAAAALRAGNFVKLGELISESHRSLAEDYEVSSTELNLMLKLAQQIPGFLGGRMTGAGFGGSTVNVVKAAAAPAFASELAAAYQRETGIHPDVMVCHASNGVEEID